MKRLITTMLIVSRMTTKCRKTLSVDASGIWRRRDLIYCTAMFREVQMGLLDVAGSVLCYSMLNLRKECESFVDMKFVLPSIWLRLNVSS